MIDERTARRRALNDALREYHVGGAIIITAPVKALGDDVVSELVFRVAAFTDFDQNNDPYGEHDFAILVYQGRRFAWQIEYCNGRLLPEAADPADEGTTFRILTIKLVNEGKGRETSPPGRSR